MSENFRLDRWTVFRLRKTVMKLKQGVSNGFSWFYQIIEIVLFLPLTVFLLVLLYRTFQAFTVDDLGLASSTGTAAGAIATLFLVGITLRYARTTRVMAESIRNEQRRPFITGLVGEGIDGYLEWLERDRKKWKGASDSKCTKFPELDIAVINDSYRRDIKSNHPSVEGILSSYVEHHQNFRGLFDELIDDISEFLEDEFEKQNLPEHIEDIIPPELEEEEIRSDLGRHDHTELIVQKRSRQLAHSILTIYPTQIEQTADNLGPNNLSMLLFLHSTDDFMEVRAMDRFSKKIKTLSELLAILKEENPKITEALEWVRTKYVEKYELMETEIENIESDNQFVK